MSFTAFNETLSPSSVGSFVDFNRYQRSQFSTTTSNMSKHFVKYLLRTHEQLLTLGSVIYITHTCGLTSETAGLKIFFISTNYVFFIRFCQSWNNVTTPRSVLIFQLLPRTVTIRSHIVIDWCRSWYSQLTQSHIDLRTSAIYECVVSMTARRFANALTNLICVNDIF